MDDLCCGMAVGKSALQKFASDAQAARDWFRLRLSMIANRSEPEEELELGFQKSALTSSWGRIAKPEPLLMVPN
eukprot:1866924-Rhodomonas_salina.1